MRQLFFFLLLSCSPFSPLSCHPPHPFCSPSPLPLSSPIVLVSSHLFHSVHTNRGAVQVNFFTGSAQNLNTDKLKNAHAGLAFFAWGILIPFGSFVARYPFEYTHFKNKTKTKKKKEKKEKLFSLTVVDTSDVT